MLDDSPAGSAPPEFHTRTGPLPVDSRWAVAVNVLVVLSAVKLKFRLHPSLNLSSVLMFDVTTAVCPPIVTVTPTKLFVAQFWDESVSVVPVEPVAVLTTDWVTLVFERSVGPDHPNVGIVRGGSGSRVKVSLSRTRLCKPQVWRSPDPPRAVRWQIRRSIRRPLYPAP